MTSSWHLAASNLRQICIVLGLVLLAAWGRPTVSKRLFVGVPLATDSSTPSALQQPEPQRLYEQLCTACHGPKGAGDGPAATALKPRPADFTDSAFQATRTDPQLTAVITGGKPPMPAFGEQLSAAQVRSLVEYIRQLGRPAKKKPRS